MGVSAEEVAPPFPALVCYANAMPTSPPPMAHARTGARIERFETFVAGHASRSVVPVGVVWLRPLVLYESDF